MGENKMQLIIVTTILLYFKVQSDEIMSYSHDSGFVTSCIIIFHRASSRKYRHKS